MCVRLPARLAYTGYKTLLIDCDLFHPEAHQHFRLAAEPGFSAVLRGDLSPADATTRTHLPYLWMIPAGKWCSNAVMALANERGRVLFDLLKAEYDFIIVNAGPVLTGADALLLGKPSDAVIFSVL